MNRSPIKFPFDANKAVQAVLWLLHCHKGTIDKLKLVKLYFLADREHLVKYGRPIVGGTYYTMANGPVCSELLDLLNAVQAGSGEFPLTSKGRHAIEAHGAPNTLYLSESDLNVLDKVYGEYGHIDKWKLRDITHHLKSYKKNEPNLNEKRRILPYEDFFEDYPKQERGMLKVILDEQHAWANLS